MTIDDCGWNEYPAELDFCGDKHKFKIRSRKVKRRKIQPLDGLKIGSNIQLNDISIPDPIFPDKEITTLTCVVDAIDDDGLLRLSPMSAHYPDEVIQERGNSNG